MVAAVYILRKDGNQATVDGIVGAIVNADDGGSEAVTIAEAIATAQAAGHALPDGYFTSALATLTDLGTDEDAVFFTDRGRTEVIA